MDYKCNFSSGTWNQDDFLVVRSPRWENASSWVQLDDCIANTMPKEGEDFWSGTYISMLYKQKLCGNIHVETLCSFEDRMAPLIAFSKELTPVYREHLEIVLFDKGINLWHHFYNNGTPSWQLIAYLDMDLKANEKHLLVAQLRFTERGPFIFMGVNEPQIGCRLAPDWGKECYAGITACEGRNYFYNFAIRDLNKYGEINERVKL